MQCYPHDAEKGVEHEQFERASHVMWHCQYHVVWVPEYRFRMFHGPIGKEVQRCSMIGVPPLGGLEQNRVLRTRFVYFGFWRANRRGGLLQKWERLRIALGEVTLSLRRHPHFVKVLAKIGQQSISLLSLES